LSSEYLQRGLNLVAWALRATGIPDEMLGGYTDHLSAIGTDFMGLRDTLMFVDYEHGTWTRNRSIDKGFVEHDVLSLELGAVLLEAELSGQPTFTGVVETFTRLEHDLRQSFPELIREILGRYAEQFKQE
jgi:hypothetical protein